MFVLMFHNFMSCQLNLFPPECNVQWNYYAYIYYHIHSYLVCVVIRNHCSDIKFWHAVEGPLRKDNLTGDHPLLRQLFFFVLESFPFILPVPCKWSLTSLKTTFSEPFMCPCKWTYHRGLLFKDHFCLIFRVTLRGDFQ